jgi:hypothetical protein
MADQPSGPSMPNGDLSALGSGHLIIVYSHTPQQRDSWLPGMMIPPPSTVWLLVDPFFFEGDPTFVLDMINANLERSGDDERGEGHGHGCRCGREGSRI